MTSPTILRRPVPPSLRPVQGVGESFFVHAPSSKVSSVAPLCAMEALGAVYTMPTGDTRSKTLKSTVELHRHIAGAEATVLVDANRYSGKNRLLASAPLSRRWLEEQWDLGITWAITDSGYVDRGATNDLRALVANAKALSRSTTGQFFLAVPIDVKWVTEDAEQLRKLVEAHGIPVAYMLGSPGDPLASRKAVEGLLYLLESPVTSALMRTDQSAIGALAGNATFSAMGTSATLRHIYPPRPGGFGPNPPPSVLVPQGLSHHRTDTLAAAIGLTPDERHWLCECERCQAARLDTILDPVDAFSHNVHAITDIARHVLQGGDRAASLRSWTATCRNAQFVHMDIANSTQMNWNSPRFLAAWVAARS